MRKGNRNKTGRCWWQAQNHSERIMCRAEKPSKFKIKVNLCRMKTSNIELLIKGSKCGIGNDTKQRDRGQIMRRLWSFKHRKLNVMLDNE